MKSPTELPNVDRWLVYCCEHVFIDSHLCVQRLRRQCTVNHLILNTWFVFDIQSIYMINELTNVVTKC